MEKKKLRKVPAGLLGVYRGCLRLGTAVIYACFVSITEGAGKKESQGRRKRADEYEIRKEKRRHGAD